MRVQLVTRWPDSEKEGFHCLMFLGNVILVCSLKYVYPFFYAIQGEGREKMANTKGVLLVSGMVLIWLKVFWNFTQEGS